MAEPGKRNGSPQIGSAVVLVAALIAGMMWRNAPLRSARPGEPSADKQVILSPNRVRARLWQDPLQAIADHRKQEHEGKEPRCREESHEHFQISDALRQGPVRLLLIPVDGDPYAESVESRLRERYAVVSALGAEGYEPVEPGAIGYVARKATPPEIGTDLPFEAYQADKDQGPPPPPVLVVWMAGSDQSGTPLHAARSLVELVRRELELAPSGSIVSMIGPRSSQTLRDMITEARKAESTPDSPQITVFSPWATASEVRLARGDPAKAREAFSKLGFRLVRAVASDDDVAQALVDELRRYGIDAREPETDIAIVTEWDTLYGRFFPDTLQAAIGSAADGASHLHRYSYLRGLDGSVPRSPAEEKPGTQRAESAVPSAEELKARQEALERPEGNGQLDYLRRLADRIDATEAELEQPCSTQDRLRDGCRRIRAIGVLGSDVYDKLLVLQALRPRFPDAMFFATDLDAVLTHGAQIDWTRNVLVASAYGLRLADSWQGAIPPFRDSYETATFVATRAALGRLLPIVELPTPSLFHASLARPVRLFEVGRDGTVDLSVEDDPLHPPRNDVATWSAKRLAAMGFLWFLSALLVVLLALPWVGRRDRLRKEVISWQLFLLLMALVLVPLAAVCLAWAEGARGEPFLLLSGVSVWPTIVLRVYAFLLGAYLIWKVFQQLRNSTAEIEALKEFGPFKLGDAGNKARTSRARITFGAWSKRWCDNSDEGGLWGEYQKRARLLPQLVRVGVFVTGFLAVGWLLMGIFGYPRVPARGHTADCWHWVTLWASVLSLLVLNYLVVDSTWLCERFVDELGRLKISECGLPPERRAVLRLRLIEKRTIVVGPFVYYPLTLLTLMVVARSPFFDDWHVPIGLAAIFGILGLYVVGCAVTLSWAAGRARRAVLDDLEERRTERQGEVAGDPVGNRIAAAIERIKGLSAGAFAPVTQHPLVSALLVPAGGVGLLTLLETWYALR